MDKQKMRLGLYRKIEIARKQLTNMDEEAFRGLLRSEFGVSSRKDMNIHQLSRLVQLFAEQYGARPLRLFLSSFLASLSLASLAAF